VISVDEFGPLEVRPHPGTTWALVGHPRRRRATYRRPHGVTFFFGAYDLREDRLMGRSFDRKRHQEFLAFLGWLRSRYPATETLHLILDNLSTHLKGKVRRWARQHRIRFHFTPTNASWLNPIEPHFGGISEFVIKGSDCANRTELRKNIQKYLRWMNANPNQKRIQKAMKRLQLCETRH